MFRIISTLVCIVFSLAHSHPTASNAKVVVAGICVCLVVLQCHRNGAVFVMFQSRCIRFLPSLAHCLLLVYFPQLTITPEDQEQIRQVLAPMNVIPLFAPLEDHKSFGSYCLYVLGPALHNVLETSTRDENEFSLAKLVKGFEAYKKVSQCIFWCQVHVVVLFVSVLHWHDALLL
jgi:hypothetical protein